MLVSVLQNMSCSLVAWFNCPIRKVEREADAATCACSPATQEAGIERPPDPRPVYVHGEAYIWCHISHG